ncbi:MAG: Maf family nucleotide pyrophosphatase [Phocaeicola sp.]|nr:Maf family nucleotide pyrophosphatase [Phocaeicola sp.]MDY3914013.1 Maf family nucleotide pyrophosphatase [Phocaeicola sp.]
MKKNPRLILASNSPRRKELLASLGYEFTVRTIQGIDESFPTELKGTEVAAYIAHQKARAYEQVLVENEIIITADTVVCLGDEVLGKPKDATEAVRMLTALSGKEHKVHTAVCILSLGKRIEFVSSSTVRFKSLSTEEIQYYVEHYLPLDKAGAYGIQEWIGHIAVEHISGSYFNIMGLPTHDLYEHLSDMGILPY